MPRGGAAPAVRPDIPLPGVACGPVNDIAAEDERMLGRMFIAAKKIAEDLGIAESGYRLIVNVNEHGGQEVYHIHMHLLGGERVGPMVANKG